MHSISSTALSSQGGRYRDCWPRYSIRRGEVAGGRQHSRIEPLTDSGRWKGLEIGNTRRFGTFSATYDQCSGGMNETRVRHLSDYLVGHEKVVSSSLKRDS